MSVMVGTGDGAQVEAERLEAELAVVCGALNQVSARLVALTARAIESEGWAGAGIRSVEHWLVLPAGLSPGRARQVVLMARRVGVLPVVMGQFAAGRLSVDQVAVVARHAPAQGEGSVAELAVSASVPQLGRALSRYAFDPPTGTTRTRSLTPTRSWFPVRWRWSRRCRGPGGRGSGRSCRCASGRVAGSSCGSPRRPMSGRWSRLRSLRPATRCSTPGRRR